MRFAKFSLFAAASMLWSLPSLAVDNGFYLGGSVGLSNTQFDERLDGERFNYDADSFGYKLIGGWRFLDWLSVEANWVDLGTADDKISGQKIETSVDGFSGSVVGFLPIGPVDLFARAGAIAWNADIRAPGLASDSDDGTDFTWGVGAQFRVWSLSLRAEYEQFDVADADTVDLISVGVTWTFL
jgi:OOP family OmpA-OmpF porin